MRRLWRREIPNCYETHQHQGGLCPQESLQRRLQVVHTQTTEIPDVHSVVGEQGTKVSRDNSVQTEGKKKTRPVWSTGPGNLGTRRVARPATYRQDGRKSLGNATWSCGVEESVQR